jgi:acyl carrier protein
MSVTDNDRAQLQESFKRCRAGTVDAILRFRTDKHPDALRASVYGIIDRFITADAPVKIDEAPDDTRLAEDLGIDSLTLLEIVLSLEEALQVRVEDAELRNIRTLGDVKTYLARKSSEAPGNPAATHSNGHRTYDRAAIQAALPQQPPFLFLDQAEVDNNGVHARFTPSPAESFFTGHFKNNPILPASILFESLGQAGCLWILAKVGHHPEISENPSELLFASMEGAQFFRKVKPGETLSLTVKIKTVRKPLAVFQATAEINGEKVATISDLVLAFGDLQHLLDQNPG